MTIRDQSLSLMSRLEDGPSSRPGSRRAMLWGWVIPDSEGRAPYTEHQQVVCIYPGTGLHKRSSALATGLASSAALLSRPQGLLAQPCRSPSAFATGFL